MTLEHREAASIVRGSSGLATSGRPLRGVTEFKRKFVTGLTGLAIVGGLVGVSLPAATSAKPKTIQITEQRQLRFGKIAVPNSGERVVSTDGTIRDFGVLSAGVGDTGPANFVLTYDRGNESKRVITVEVQLRISSGEFSSGGLQARLKNLTSDIPGQTMIVEGQPISLTLPNCRTRVCRTEFLIGGTLEVTNSSGGGEVAIPTYLDVAVIQVD